MIAFAHSVEVDDLVEALIGYAPRAVIPAGNLAAMLGVEEPAIIEAARNAEADDRAVYWQEIGAVVLGMAEAESRGLALYSASADDEVRPDGWSWRPAGEIPREKPPRRRSRFVSLEMAELIGVSHQFTDDDSPSIRRWQRVIEHAERISRREEGACAILERIACGDSPSMHTLGVGRLHWRPEIEAQNPDDCSFCGGRRLGLTTLCLGCLRSGLDPFLERIREKRSRRKHKLDPKGLAGGTGGKPS